MSAPDLHAPTEVVVDLCRWISDTEYVRCRSFAAMWLVGAGIATSACGRVGYDELGSSGDAGIAAACAEYGAFSAPVLVAGLVNTTNSEFSPTLSADELDIYFHANHDGLGLGSDDIWIAQRASVDDPFDGFELVVELSSVEADGAPFLSHDGLTMLLSSSRPGGVGGNDIWIATRSSAAAAFSQPVNVPVINSASSETGPFLSADGLTLYFGSNRPGGPSSTNIWAASRPTLDDPFGEPSVLAELDIGASVEAPSLSDDELTIYFDGEGAGMTDLYVASRPDRGQDFSAPTPVTELNSASADYSPEISASGDTLYFTSNREPGVGNDDLWLATRQCLRQ